MREHLRRFGWLYALCALLAAFPLLIFHLSRFDPVDPATTAAFEPLIFKKFKEANPTLVWVNRHPMPLWDELSNEQSLMAKSNWIGLGSALPEALPRELPALKQSINQLGEAAAEMNQLSQYVVLQNDNINFLSLQSYAKLERTLAEAEMAEGNWEQAAQRLKRCAEAADPVRFNGMTGSLIAMAVRSIGYAGYLELAKRPATAATLRAALADLEAMRPSEPQLNELNAMFENFFSLQMYISILSQPYERNSEKVLPLLSQALAPFAAINMIARRDKLGTPSLRNWAERLNYQARGRFYKWENTKSKEENAYAAFYSDLSWTRMRAIDRWLRAIAEKENAAWNRLGLTEAEMTGLDRRTLLLVSNSQMLEPNGNTIPDNARERVEVMRLRRDHAEAAVRARLRFAESGAWPEEQELRALADQDGQTSKSLHAGWIALNEADARAMFWRDRFPLVFNPSMNNREPVDNCITNDGEFRWAGVFKDAPMLPFLIAGTLRRQPSLIDGEVGVSMLYGETDGLSLSQFMEKAQSGIIPNSTGWPLDLTDAYKLYQLHDTVEKLENPRPFGGPGQQPSPTFVEDAATSYSAALAAERDFTKQGIAKVSAKLKAPERAYAVWSNGPDGRDDGGLISYDPTNGTVSGGDMISFLESFEKEEPPALHPEPLDKARQ